MTFSLPLPSSLRKLPIVSAPVSTVASVTAPISVAAPVSAPVPAISSPAVPVVAPVSAPAPRSTVTSTSVSPVTVAVTATATVATAKDSTVERKRPPYPFPEFSGDQDADKKSRAYIKRNMTTELANCAKQIHPVWQRKNTLHLADCITTNYCVPERFKSYVLEMADHLGRESKEKSKS